MYIGQTGHFHRKNGTHKWRCPANVLGFFLVFFFQEDVNGEKLTVKRWWIFGADFFTVWCRFFTIYADFSRFIRDTNGGKKNISLSMIFFTVSFSRFAPSQFFSPKHTPVGKYCEMNSENVLHVTELKVSRT